MPILFCGVNIDIKYQNKGIGSHIIEEVTEQLKLCGYLKVRLGVDKGNPQSFAFWTKNQFKAVAEKEYIAKSVLE